MGDKLIVFGIFDYTMLPKLNKILRTHGLRLQRRSNRNWGDQLEISVIRTKQSLTAEQLLNELVENAPLDHIGTGSVASGEMSEKEWKERVSKLRAAIRGE